MEILRPQKAGDKVGIKDQNTVPKYIRLLKKTRPGLGQHVILRYVTK
jgi:hypothetical protein